VSRIKNLLDYKDSVERTYKRIVEAIPGQMDTNEVHEDEVFIRDAVAVIEKNLINADFSVDDWCRGMKMSRTSLYKRS
jgi:hypothetical protein